MSRKKTVALWLPADLLKAVDELAEQEQRSRSNLVALALWGALKNKDGWLPPPLEIHPYQPR